MEHPLGAGAQRGLAFIGIQPEQLIVSFSGAAMIEKSSHIKTAADQFFKIDRRLFLYSGCSLLFCQRRSF